MKKGSLTAPFFYIDTKNIVTINTTYTNGLRSICFVSIHLLSLINIMY